MGGLIGFVKKQGKHGMAARKDQEAARLEGIEYIEQSLHNARARVSAYTLSLANLERADRDAKALEKAGKLAEGEVKDRLEAHREKRFNVRLEQVPAWSVERLRLEALLVDLGQISIHLSQVATESAARVASMRRQLEGAERDVKTKTAELAAAKARI